MKKFLARNTILYLLGAGMCLSCFYAIAAQAQQETSIEPLTFSNTQTWSPRFLHMAESAVDAPDIALPVSPKNKSRTTRKDLALMHAYQRTRTEKDINEIKQEININDALFGENTFAQLLEESRHPQTFVLMKEVVELESPQIMKQKKIHNRVRPSYLDPTIKPVIDVPPHPAYPSGHATQAYLRAFVLSELDPKNRDQYRRAAKRIAHNREIAGLHYPSDSIAGALLAKQLFKKLMQNPGFVEQLEKAKAEW
jgi:acid phosphatase (class A)